MAAHYSESDRVTAWLLRELPASAPAWLPAERWFGGKSRSIERVEIVDVLWLTPESAASASAIIIMDVRYATGAPFHDWYAALVGIYGEPRGCLEIGRLPWDPARHVVEAASDGRAVHALLQGLTSAESVRGVRGGEVVYADASARVERMLTPGPDALPPVVPVGVEQSNSSVRVGSEFVFKLFRRLEPGENPQIEIGRFLTRQRFLSAPSLEGSLTYRTSDGRECALGALEGWVTNTGDGWRHVVAGLRRVDRDAAPIDELARDLSVLGTTTARFHGALACNQTVAAFAPEPVTALDVQRWVADAQTQAARAIGLIEGHHAQWATDAADLGRSVLASRRALTERLQRFEWRPDERFNKIRIHGDYHLGQTLKTPNGFAIIDFEGEPAKPLAERRGKHCVLKDLAGMMRSIDYAGQTAGVTNAAATTHLREAFASGYSAGALTHEVQLLPFAPGAVVAWTEFFELEKALYEVEYEVNNRPDWVHIPLRSILRLLPADEEGRVSRA